MICSMTSALGIGLDSMTDCGGICYRIPATRRQPGLFRSDYSHLAGSATPKVDDLLGQSVDVAPGSDFVPCLKDCRPTEVVNPERTISPRVGLSGRPRPALLARRNREL